MMQTSRGRGERGFTLVEMLVSMGIFLVICGSAFTLLGVSQQRYATESQVMNSFQEARLGLDQMVRDVSDAGYPAPNQFEVLPPVSQYAAAPLAWFPGYPNAPCPMNGGCTTPESYGMFIETNPNPQGGNTQVQYIRYHLIGTTLYRGVSDKQGQDPWTGTADNTLVPFVQNVMNTASAAQIAQIQAAYPTLFPGGTHVPLFKYVCDTPLGPQDCSIAGAPYNVPTNVRSVIITLIVETPTPDAQTGQVRVIELTGRGTRMNSFQ
jgi:prepilin-type N-terminal cleavage/methylation domain-containing protein